MAALVALALVAGETSLAGLDAVARVRSLSLQAALVASSPSSDARRLHDTLDELEVEHARLQRAAARAAVPTAQATALATELTRFSRLAEGVVPGRSAVQAAALADEATSRLPAALTPLADHFVARAAADGDRRGWLQGMLGVVVALALLTLIVGGGRRRSRLRLSDPQLDVMCFDESMLEALAEPMLLRACLEDQPLSLLVLEVEGLETIEARTGRQTVLRTVLAAGRSELRSEDRFLPLQGERFVALLPETSLAAASRVGARLRRAVDELVVVHDGAPLVVNASVGVATLRDIDIEVGALLERATDALAREGPGAVATEPAPRATLRLVGR